MSKLIEKTLREAIHQFKERAQACAHDLALWEREVEDIIEEYKKDINNLNNQLECLGPSLGSDKNDSYYNSAPQGLSTIIHGTTHPSTEIHSDGFRLANSGNKSDTFKDPT